MGKLKNIEATDDKAVSVIKQAAVHIFHDWEKAEQNTKYIYKIYNSLVHAKYYIYILFAFNIYMYLHGRHFFKDK